MIEYECIIRWKAVTGIGRDRRSSDIKTVGGKVIRVFVKLMICSARIVHEIKKGRQLSLIHI